MRGRDGVTSAGQGGSLQMQTHLGAKLRQLFDAPRDPLPERFIELLNALAAQKKQRPPISSSFKSSLLVLIPNLRAFAFSLCGNHEQADDLVQETLLKNLLLLQIWKRLAQMFIDAQQREHAQHRPRLASQAWHAQTSPHSLVWSWRGKRTGAISILTQQNGLRLLYWEP
jgi:hypothetical protein